jgi:hypothetical protein
MLNFVLVHLFNKPNMSTKKLGSYLFRGSDFCASLLSLLIDKRTLCISAKSVVHKGILR